MSERKLVSVLTPTWQRRDLLLEAVENAREQAYRPLEHVIVSDGPDPELRDLIERERGADVPIRFIELGRNFTEGGPPNSFGIGALMAGMLLARGAYQVWLCDDERMAPDHISSLVAVLEEGNAGFAYSKTRMWWVGSRPEDGWDIGTCPPQYGQITNYLYRSELLRVAMPAWGAHPVDWTLVASWMRAGERCAFLPRVTLTHRADR